MEKGLRVGGKLGFLERMSILTAPQLGHSYEKTHVLLRLGLPRVEVQLFYALLAGIPAIRWISI
jgi:hypothetical protein